jgi:hypothetical protein
MSQCNVALKYRSYFLLKKVHAPLIPTPWSKLIASPKAHESDDLDGAFVLTPDVQAPTVEEVAAVPADVDDDALTCAIEAVKVTVRASGRLRVDSLKMWANKAV